MRFSTVSNLINDLQAAQRDLRIFKVTAWFTKLDLLVLDEVGYSPFREGEAQLLFQLCSQLYERVSIILTTNLRFADWDKVFQDETLTAALLDRLIHKAHILEFVGESYRFRQRRELEEPAHGSGSTEAG